MTAIQSLLRVMVLRDAEAIILEAGKVPNLRRRGQIEALAMPALDATLLHEFAMPILAARGIDLAPHSLDGSAARRGDAAAIDGLDALDSAVSAPFSDPDGANYQISIERGRNGLRIVARRASPAPVQARTAPAPSPVNETGAEPAIGRATPSTAPVDRLKLPEPNVGSNTGTRLARLANLLEPAVVIATARNASDVIVSSGQPLHLRIDGQLTPVEDFRTNDAELATCVAALADHQDASLEIAGTRLRVNVFDHLGGVGVAARVIRDRVPSLRDLELPAELQLIVEQRDGLVVVCGPTGSGKSTTLVALVDALDQRRSAHVITLEDPIEYRFHPRRCLVHQREIGTHAPSFAEGLRAALRETPDVILLGEMRDRETIAAALTAAETGHLVLATLHAPSAAGAVDRIIDVFPEVQQRQVRWQLAGVLRTIVTQYLLPKRDGGRAVAVEHVPVTAAVANIIRKGELQTLSTAINTGRAAGMIPLERSLARLLDTGSVEPAAVAKIATDHDLLAALSGRISDKFHGNDRR